LAGRCRSGGLAGRAVRASPRRARGEDCGESAAEDWGEAQATERGGAEYNARERPNWRGHSRVRVLRRSLGSLHGATYIGAAAGGKTGAAAGRLGGCGAPVAAASPTPAAVSSASAACAAARRATGTRNGEQDT